MVRREGPRNITLYNLDAFFLRTSTAPHHKHLLMLELGKLFEEVFQSNLLLSCFFLLLFHLVVLLCWAPICLLLLALVAYCRFKRINLVLQHFNLPISLVNINKNLPQSLSPLHHNLKQLLCKRVGIPCNPHPHLPPNSLRYACLPQVS